MGSESPPLHILFFPFMIPGHMLPMVDLARLFASHGVKATILTTPANAPTLPPSNSTSPNPISLSLVPFPSAEVGLPDGCETMSSLPQSLRLKFFTAVSLLRQPFHQILADIRPDCVITDMFLPWTLDVANEHNIPRIVFHGMCFFSLCARAALDVENLPPEVESFVIPGIPHRIEMLRTQLPDADMHKRGAGFVETFKLMKESDLKSYGVVTNSFYELEPDYADHYRTALGRRAWHVGPVSLCNRDDVEKTARGRKASIDGEAVLEWLDGEAPGSVVYVCFGSMAEHTAAQLRELALGLEASGRPFIWVVGTHEGRDWLPEGFGQRGLVIWGWAPQILILNHGAVGAFVTHCGWNSTLEGVSGGVAMVTWPMFAEQFYNEKLIVEVLRIGVGVGVREYGMRPEERPIVEAAAIEGAVRRVLGEGEEAEGRRVRARELGEMAKRAVVESGSSFIEMDNLIKELMARRTPTL